MSFFRLMYKYAINKIYKSVSQVLYCNLSFLQIYPFSSWLLAHNQTGHLSNLQRRKRERKRMESGKEGDLSGEMEVDAYRRLFPLRFYERHLLERA